MQLCACWNKWTRVPSYFWFIIITYIYSTKNQPHISSFYLHMNTYAGFKILARNKWSCRNTWWADLTWSMHGIVNRHASLQSTVFRPILFILWSLVHTWISGLHIIITTEQTIFVSPSTAKCAVAPSSLPVLIIGSIRQYIGILLSPVSETPHTVRLSHESQWYTNTSVVTRPPRVAETYAASSSQRRLRPTT